MTTNDIVPGDLVWLGLRGGGKQFNFVYSDGRVPLNWGWNPERSRHELVHVTAPGLVVGWQLVNKDRFFLVLMDGRPCWILEDFCTSITAGGRP